MRSSKARAFTLVEIMLVIIILAILTALLLTGFSALRAVDANTEAAKLMRSLQQLRSGWLAYYADEHAMLGVSADATGKSDLTYDAANDVGRVASTLSDRMEASVADLIDRYGTVRIVSQPSNPDNGTGVYIGFTGANAANPSTNFGGHAIEIALRIQQVLAEGGYVLYGQDLKPYERGPQVLLRIK